MFGRVSMRSQQEEADAPEESEGDAPEESEQNTPTPDEHGYPVRERRQKPVWELKSTKVPAQYKQRQILSTYNLLKTTHGT